MTEWGCRSILYEAMYALSVFRWMGREEASFEMLMFRPGRKASLRKASEMTFLGRPRFPLLWMVTTLGHDTLEPSL